MSNVSNTKRDGKIVVEQVAVQPCSVHPLHAVKIHPDGSRSGCPMCEATIDALTTRSR